MRFTLQPVSRALQEYATRRADTRSYSAVRADLGRHMRVTDDPTLVGETDPAVWLWPVREGPRNRKRFMAIRPGDEILFCSKGRCIGVHPVLALADVDGPEQRAPGPDRAPYLVLAEGREIDLPYEHIHAITNLGPPAGPSGLAAIPESLSAEVAALIERPLETTERSEEPVESPAEGQTDPADGGRSRPETSNSDRMDHWHRQGLVAQADALRSAVKEAGRGNVEVLVSIRRLATALAPRMRERFAPVADSALSLSILPDEALVEGAGTLLKAIQAEIEVDAPEPVTILVVEDEPTTALVTHRIISAANRAFLFAATKAEADALIASERIDVIILDQSLPDADGRDLLAELRARPDKAGIPVVVLSGNTGAQPKAECFALGADAYFEKPVDPVALSSAVSAFLLRSAQIRDQALRDPLTGLGTREVFLRTLADAHNAASRTAEKITLGILDIDRFGAINDFHGREVGDQVLRAVAESLRTTLRRSDLVARWGDDEFAVALRDTDQAGFAGVMEKLRGSVGKAVRPLADAGVDRITFSVGVSVLGMATQVDEAIQTAELRLAHAADAGGDAFRADDDPVERGATKVLLVEDDRITAELIERRLLRDGLEVVHFEDGLDALDAAPGTDFDLVILDVATPGADGFGLLQRLRSTPSFANVPIMMLTMERQTQVSKAFNLGATDTMRKPFALAELSARVSRMLA